MRRWRGVKAARMGRRLAQVVGAGLIGPALFYQAQ